MKLKVLLSLGLLALASTTANAVATVYTLQSIRFDNAFVSDWRIPGGFFGGGSGTLPGACTGCGVSTATESGGNVSIIGAAWSVNGFGQIYSNSFDATTTLGLNVALSKSNRSCINVLGSFCTGNFGGLGGSDTWGVGVSQNTLSPCLVTPVDGDPFLSCVTDVTISGTELYVSRQVPQSDTLTASQTYTLIYSTVPVPAAVWLFGSSLGLLGLARRNRKAA